MLDQRILGSTAVVSLLAAAFVSGCDKTAAAALTQFLHRSLIAFFAAKSELKGGVRPAELPVSGGRQERLLTSLGVAPGISGSGFAAKAVSPLLACSPRAQRKPPRNRNTRFV
jgi:hypothetical protein